MIFMSRDAWEFVVQPGDSEVNMANFNSPWGSCLSRGGRLCRPWCWPWLLHPHQIRWICCVGSGLGIPGANIIRTYIHQGCLWVDIKALWPSYASGNVVSSHYFISKGTYSIVCHNKNGDYRRRLDVEPTWTYSPLWWECTDNMWFHFTEW